MRLFRLLRHQVDHGQDDGGGDGDADDDRDHEVGQVHEPQADPDRGSHADPHQADAEREALRGRGGHRLAGADALGSGVREAARRGDGRAGSGGVRGLTAADGATGGRGASSWIRDSSSSRSGARSTSSTAGGRTRRGRTEGRLGRRGAQGRGARREHRGGGGCPGWGAPRGAATGWAAFRDAEASNRGEPARVREAQAGGRRLQTLGERMVGLGDRRIAVFVADDLAEEARLVDDLVVGDDVGQNARAEPARHSRSQRPPDDSPSGRVTRMPRILMASFPEGVFWRCTNSRNAGRVR